MQKALFVGTATVKPSQPSNVPEPFTITAHIGLPKVPSDSFPSILSLWLHCRKARIAFRPVHPEISYWINAEVAA